MNPLQALLAFEIVKLRGRRITWVPYMVLALIVGLIVAVFYKLQFKHPLALFQQANLGVTSKEDFVNGYYMAAHAMNPIFQLMLPIFIAVASGLMVAGEAENGTLRACLIRPVRRRDLILSKFTVLSFYALTLCIFFLALVLVAGILNFGQGNLLTLNVLFNNGELGASMIPEAEVPVRFILAGLIATMGMMVLSALALMISALVETAAMSYVITLSIYFTVLTLRMFPALDWLYPYLFVSHMMRWQQCFYSYVKVGDIYVSLIHLAFYLIAFLSAAVLLFNEKDIKT
jgi:ABC-type transport system involved in multi-copper enzyme maturation permease subunit